MTIERDLFVGAIAFRCDGPKCHEYDETHCSDFSGALAKLRSHGWTSRKDGDDWLHFCGDCA